MFLIIGLGNPGDKYKLTRHNIGFNIVDFFHEAHSGSFSDFETKGKFESEMSEGQVEGERVFLVKPLTYMNNIGRAVSKIRKAYNVSNDNIIVLQDDSDLIIGRMKIKKGGQGAGHKGIMSINSYLGSGYIRILIGIRDGHLDLGKKSEEFVLKKFPADGEDLILQSKQKALEALDFLIKNQDFSKAMSLFNINFFKKSPKY